jgi:hypothetical protein
MAGRARTPRLRRLATAELTPREIAAIRALGYDEETTAGFLGGNFSRLMGLSDDEPLPGPSAEAARG